MDDLAEDIARLDGKTPAEQSVERASALIRWYQLSNGHSYSEDRLPFDEVIIDLLADLKHWVEKHGDHYVAGYDYAWEYFDEESTTHWRAEQGRRMKAALSAPTCAWCGYALHISTPSWCGNCGLEAPRTAEAPNPPMVACERCDYIGPENAPHDRWNGTTWVPCKGPCRRCGHGSGQHEPFLDCARRPCLVCDCSSYSSSALTVGNAGSPQAAASTEEPQG